MRRCIASQGGDLKLVELVIVVSVASTSHTMTGRTKTWSRAYPKQERPVAVWLVRSAGTEAQRIAGRRCISEKL